MTLFSPREPIITKMAVEALIYVWRKLREGKTVDLSEPALPLDWVGRQFFYEWC